MIPLGPFELSDVLGGGGMGEVWAGQSRRRRIPVAVKVLTGDAARRPKFIAGFRKEVRAVAGLDHPSIIPVYDFGEVSAEAEEASSGRLPAGSPFVAMELLEGGSLAPLAGQLTWTELRQVLLLLLDALSYAHSHGLVHRDIKPANVLLGRSGSGLKLTDFGLAHAVERDSLAGEKGQLHGTPAYMAPEQWEGRWRDYGPWTDLYAVGGVAYALTAGTPPFGVVPSLPKMMTLHLRRAPPPLPDGLQVPTGFGAWIARLLEKEPGHRFHRAADAAWALLRLDERDGAEGRAQDPSVRSVLAGRVGPAFGPGSNEPDRPKGRQNQQPHVTLRLVTPPWVEAMRLATMEPEGRSKTKSPLFARSACPSIGPAPARDGRRAGLGPQARPLPGTIDGQASIPRPTQGDRRRRVPTPPTGSRRPAKGRSHRRSRSPGVDPPRSAS